MSLLRHITAAAVLAATVGAQADDTTTAQTPQELLKALEAAGYDLSGVATVNEDGTVSVATPDVSAEGIEGDAAEMTEGSAAEGGADTAEAVAETPPADPDVKWDTKLTVGFGLSSGNTDNANVNALIVSIRETDTTKLTLDSAYFYSENDGDQSENRFTAGVNHDWYLPDSKWILFASARYDYDEFQSWRHRVQAHGGAGYKLIEEENFKFTPRFGLGASKEFLSNNEDLNFEGLLGADLEWIITERQRFVLNSTYYPFLDDLGEFRWVTSAGYEIQIDKADGLAFTIGLLHEYQSRIDPGKEHNDFRLFGGLTFDF